jgi:hypothetical protein
MSFGLVEYWEIVSVMEVASVGLRWKRFGIGEWPEVEVNACLHWVDKIPQWCANGGKLVTEKL